MPDAFIYSGERKSFQSFKELYFCISVIKDWKHLLKNDVMKRCNEDDYNKKFLMA
jgi:predicted nucleic acid-binding OB-fold protein